MAADGTPVVWSREIGCIYYLSKGWRPQYGGQFVDIQSQRWPIAPCFTPAHNTLLAFAIPVRRPHGAFVAACLR
jgi:Rps23 Pro-64 3,4-dihydroxylase Tpa1-like proline 4-hydroxylase